MTGVFRDGQASSVPLIYLLYALLLVLTGSLDLVWTILKTGV